MVKFSSSLAVSVHRNHSFLAQVQVCTLGFQSDLSETLICVSDKSEEGLSVHVQSGRTELSKWQCDCVTSFFRECRNMCIYLPSLGSGLAAPCSVL